MKLKPILFLFYCLLWIALAIDPWYRSDWILENLLVFAALPIIVRHEKRFGFSASAAWMLFIFFVLHAIGAHFTYSQMPYFQPITDFFGFERNHYDRLIHFLFGLLLFLPFYEVFSPFQKSRKHMLLLTLLFLFSASGFYEICEWIVTQLTHPDLGAAFLGIQGDEWDAQKDMAWGYLGALIAAFFNSAQFRKLRRRFFSDLYQLTE